MATLAEKTVLDPACPGRWMEGGYEPMFELSWRDYGDVQLEVLKRSSPGSAPRCRRSTSWPGAKA